MRRNHARCSNLGLVSLQPLRFTWHAGHCGRHRSKSQTALAPYPVRPRRLLQVAAGAPPCSGNTQRLIVEPAIETAALLLMPRLQFKPSANAARSWPGARRVPDDMCRAITTTGVTPEMAYARWV